MVTISDPQTNNIPTFISGCVTLHSFAHILLTHKQVDRCCLRCRVMAIQFTNQLKSKLEVFLVATAINEHKNKSGSYSTVTKENIFL